MINWLIEQAAIMTPLLLMFILFQSAAIKKLGARVVYSFWIIIPLSLLLSYFNFSPLFQLNGNTQALFGDQDHLIHYHHVVQQNTGSLLLLWLIGAGSLLSKYLIQHLLFFRSLDVSECLPLQKQLPKNINAYCSPQLSTPISAGLFTKFIVVPQCFFTEYTEQQQKLVLTHELQHIKRGDLYWNLLVILVHAAFWFNPLVWLARKHFHLCQEVSCDERVLQNAKKDEKLSYLHALLITSNSQSHPSPIYSAFSEQAFYRFRLTQITAKSKINRFYLFPSSVLLLLVCTGMQSSINNLEQMANNLIKPIMRVVPIYPQQAVAKNIEGFAIASFSVNQQGQTENIQINASHPQGAFDSQVLNAIKTWRYTKPYSNVEKVEVQVDFRKHTSHPVELKKQGIEGILVTPKVQLKP